MWQTKLNWLVSLAQFSRYFCGDWSPKKCEICKLDFYRPNVLSVTQSVCVKALKPIYADFQYNYSIFSIPIPRLDRITHFSVLTAYPVELSPRHSVHAVVIRLTKQFESQVREVLNRQSKSAVRCKLCHKSLCQMRPLHFVRYLERKSTLHNTTKLTSDVIICNRLQSVTSKLLMLLCFYWRRLFVIVTEAISKEFRVACHGNCCMLMTWQW